VFRRNGCEKKKGWREERGMEVGARFHSNLFEGIRETA
jgi:hypothetical protein